VERNFRASLWTILVAGVAVSATVAALTGGDPFDMESFRLVRDMLDQHPLLVYVHFTHIGVARWPYPPGFFPWIWAAGRLAALAGGTGFAFLIRVPIILADAGIAWTVQDFLGWRGARPGTRLLAAALVSIGPSFVLIAGYHGQFDAVAFLPGVVALSLWSRTQAPWRAIAAGLLIGLGCALKTVPLLLLVALLPTARSRREAITLIGAALVPVIVCFFPYWVAGTLPPGRVLTYHGIPGAGDLSLVAQPDLAKLALGLSNPSESGITQFLYVHGTVIVVCGLLVVAAVGARARPAAASMAALLWLGVYAFGVNFFYQYVVWGLPFFLMAGFVRSVLVVQLALLPGALLFYLRPWHDANLAIVYATLMIAIWTVTVIVFVILGRRLWRTETSRRDGHRELVGAEMASS
jgi:hypothetical protein